jgi:hypothetical protein
MPNKFKKGESIDTVSQLAQVILSNGWVYYRDKVLHPSFVLHMSFATVLGGLNAHQFSHTEKKGTV